MARERILAAAGPVFARRGFDGATIREIAKNAGANIASIGYYFGDKMGLYLEVIRRIRLQCEEKFPLQVDSCASAEVQLREHIRVMLSRMLNDQDETGWEAQLMMREMHRPTIAFKELVEQYFRPNFDLLCDILRQLLPVETPLEVCQQHAFSVVGQCLYYRVGRETVRAMIAADVRALHFNHEALVDHITRVTLAAAGH